MQSRPQRSAMVLAGATLIATGLVVSPGTGGAQLEDVVPTLPDPTITSTSVAIPGELDPLLEQIEGLTGSTITSTTTTTTSTTSTSTTTTTIAQTTPTTQPEAQTKEPEVLGEVISTPLGELLSQVEVPVIDVQAVIADYHRTEFPAYTPRFGKRSTLEVIQVLAQRGATPDDVARVMAPFPVAGPASYTDDWAAPRYTPSFHTHEGCDIFAEFGTPVIATMAGTVTRATMGTPVGGNVVYLQLPDGTYFYYAHLDTISPLIYPGMKVQPGQVLGTVGDTGNAEGGMPHLHFEIHPGGGDPVPPAPYLDAWLAAALDEARGIHGQPAAAPAFLPPISGTLGDQATALPAQPASFGRDSTSTLLFLIPGAVVLWWRRRRNAAFAAILDDAG